ncbi:hypothetical protein MA20_45445 [Bradyrhizobium japonicum]|uniref:Uncharacterized protein n=1 Tax=Bradyrhizobium japonicum TaxID=375 RepID=A0A0A3XJA6_BRAJP|nr:hypothetical protein MA20_45445 [Bradyrhizobium japonicum]
MSIGDDQLDLAQAEAGELAQEGIQNVWSSDCLMSMWRKGVDNERVDACSLQRALSVSCFSRFRERWPAATAR